jgi:hypothetical protein
MLGREKPQALSRLPGVEEVMHGVDGGDEGEEAEDAQNRSAATRR